MNAWIWSLTMGMVACGLIFLFERLGIARARRRIQEDACLFVEERAEWERRHSRWRPEWIQVSVESGGFRVEALPPVRPSWTVDMTWAQVSRVCVEAAGMEGDDTLYVFRVDQEESIALPLVAKGVLDLLDALTARGFFPRNRLLAMFIGSGET